MSKKINKNCVLLLFGQTISQLGSSMTSFAIVIWAYSSTGQVISSSLLAVCSAIPYLIVSLLGGAVADNMNKKKIMLICDTVAALGSLGIFICSHMNILQIWILCIVNIINGFMNAFQGPASQVALTLLVNEKDYAKIGGIQSALGAVIGMLNPILAATFLSIGGLQLVLGVDLITFLFAFITLLVFIKIPDYIKKGEKVSVKELKESMKEGVSFIKQQKSILFLLLMYSVLEFMGAISFDSMSSPLLLARTGNNEVVVGIVSSVAAAGVLLGSLTISVAKQPVKKIPVMLIGSIMCLCGIMFFGMGQCLAWWCIVVFFGCFGAPIYQTYQTVILREKVPISIQGRIFSLQGMITSSLTPLGCLLGAVLADYVFEPFMQNTGNVQKIIGRIVGTGKGAGMGLMFVVAGAIGIIMIIILGNNSYIKRLDKTNK